MAERAYREIEPSARPPVSRLDWALVSLLQRVQDKIVDPLIDRWLGVLSGDEVKEGFEDEQRILIHNIVSACLAKKKPGQRLTPARGPLLDIDSETKNSVRAGLRDAALFNSYYYIAIESDTESDSYYFFPVAPGVTTFPGQDPTGELRKFQTYLADVGLPFILRSSGRGSYNGALLPGRAGVTPQVCLNASKDPNVRSEVVSLFLNDFAILGKAEDVVQQHLSAIIVPFIQDNELGLRRCRGAFLLTSSVPNAFADPLLGKRSSWDVDLVKIIDDWVTGPIESLHRVARIESRDATVSFRTPAVARSGFPVQLESEVRQLKNEAKSWLARLMSQRVAALRFEHGGDQGMMRAVNPDALSISLRSHLCPSPLLPLASYTDKDTLVPEALRAIVTALDKLREAPREVPQDVVREVFASSVCNLASLLESTQDDQLPLAAVKADGPEICVIALHDPNMTTEARQTLTESIEGICLAIQQRRGPGSLLPGERPPIYAELEIKHHWATHLGSAEIEGQQVNASEIFQSVDAEVRRTGVIGLLVFEKANLFIPKEEIDFTGQPDLDLQRRVKRALLNPASYWLYEQLCHAVRIEEFPVQRAVKDEYYNPTFFKIDQKSLHPISVVLSNSPQLNGQFVSTINYLGVPVKEWYESDNDKVPNPFVKIEEPLSKCVAKTWANYVTTALADAVSNNAIQRAARGSDNDAEGIKIMKVEDTRCTQLELRFDYSSDNGAHGGSATIAWEKFPTLRLEFVGMNIATLADLKGSEIPGAAASRGPSELAPLAETWRPHEGWRPTEGDKDYLARLEKIIREARNIFENERAFRVAHEGRSLHQAVNDVEAALKDYRSADNAPASGEGSAQAFSRLEVAVDAMIAERAMQEMECRPHEAGSGFLLGLGQGAPARDILRLAEFARQQGLRAADLLLRSRSEHGLCRESWGALLEELTIRDSESWNLDGVRLIDPEPSMVEQNNQRILLTAKVLANLYKHSILDLAGAHPERPAAPFKVDDCSKDLLERYKVSFLLCFDETRIETRSSLFGTPDLNKEFGTRDVLKSYVNSRIWDTNGQVGWGPLGKEQFQVVLTLPAGFWA